MRRRLAFILLLLSLSPACRAQVRAAVPAGGRFLHAAAPASFSRSFTPLIQWQPAPLAPLAGTIPRAVLAEARRQAAPAAERRISAAVPALRAGPRALSPAQTRSLKNETGRPALFSPAGRTGEKTARRPRAERLMRQAGRTAERLLDGSRGDPGPASSFAVESGGASRGKIVRRLRPPKSLTPSPYYDAGHWRSSLVPDAAYGRLLDDAAALLGRDDKAGSPAEVRAAGARLALTETLRRLDAKIHSHMMRVGLLAGLIAYRMGHTLEYSRRVAWGARVHDIGKREEPIRAVVNKEGRLDEAERAVVERHPGAGAAIIALNLSLDPVSRRVGMRAALNHHENSDGSGYPRRDGEPSLPRRHELGRGGGRHVPGGP